MQDGYLDRRGENKMFGKKKNTPTEVRDLEKKLKEIKIENGEIVRVEYRPEKKKNRALIVIKLAPLPELYRVLIKLTPSPESNITVELWLPLKRWNGKFLGTGNGGFAGVVNRIGLINGASRGYAAANTDMGSTKDPDNMIGVKERVIDFSSRATHLMTTVSKQIIREFYGKEPEYSYFLGGSTGGQQGMMEAQRFPEDYDGIIVFSPANNRIRLHTFFIWNWQAVNVTKKSRFNKKEANAITKRIVEVYSREAGGAPGDKFLAYPGRIKMDINIFKDSKMKGTLKKEQLEALQKLYEGPIDSVTGEKIYATFIPGTENAALSLMDLSRKKQFAKSFFFPFRWAWGKDFDFQKFDFHKDWEKAKEQLSPIMDSTNPNLSEFRNRGGKLIMISGSVDAIIPYEDSLNYYRKVIEMEKGLINTISYFRYFMVPGLGHGFGGAGFQELGSLGLPNAPRDKEHDALMAMEAWVEKGEAPERLLSVAFKNGNFLFGKMDADRPVYRYPYMTEYVSGDTKKADSYSKSEKYSFD